jgi:hypothetical protein
MFRLSLRSIAEVEIEPPAASEAAAPVAMIDIAASRGIVVELTEVTEVEPATPVVVPLDIATATPVAVVAPPLLVAIALQQTPDRAEQPTRRTAGRSRVLAGAVAFAERFEQIVEHQE